MTGSEHSDWLVGVSTSRSEAVSMGVRASGGRDDVGFRWGSAGVTSALLHGSLSSQRGGLGAGCRGGGPTSVPVTPSGAEVQPLG